MNAPRPDELPSAFARWTGPVELPAPIADNTDLRELITTELQLDPSTGGGPRNTRFNGAALVAEGFDWPHTDNGPMRFVGQLDFAELWEIHQGALPLLPEQGVLALFYDDEAQPWGYEAEHGDGWALSYLADPQEGVEVDDPVERTLDGPRIDLQGSLAPSIVHLNDAWLEDVELDDLAHEALYDLHEPRLDSQQVGGHPKLVQFDPRETCDAIRRQTSDEMATDQRWEWNLLWQIGWHEDAGFYWGDTGSLYLYIRDEDLKARDFERAWLVLQSF